MVLCNGLVSKYSTGSEKFRLDLHSSNVLYLLLSLEMYNSKKRKKEKIKHCCNVVWKFISIMLKTLKNLAFEV